LALDNHPTTFFKVLSASFTLRTPDFRVDETYLVVGVIDGEAKGGD
jgi:hypothetical protein